MKKHTNLLLILAFLLVNTLTGFYGYHSGYQDSQNDVFRHSGIQALDSCIRTPENLLEIVNRERAAVDLHPLTMNDKLTESAQWKAQYLFDNDYWDHDLPDEEWWEIIGRVGYAERFSVGENLARDTWCNDEVVALWYDSRPHRAVMFDSSYQEIGFGRVHGFVVAHFGVNHDAEEGAKNGE